MQKIKVRYKGCDNYDSRYTSPTVLKVGQIYEIKSVGAILGYSTCTLHGIEGNFNPMWFEKAPTPTFVAISSEVPKVGNRLILKRGKTFDSFTTIKTSTITGVNLLEENIYVCETKNGTTYIVQVF